MRIDFYGLVFDTPRVSFYLWSPWRATALEHRLFDAVKNVVRAEPESAADEVRLHVGDPKTWRNAVQAVVRVLKGWQEEADAGAERRSWRWLVEGDSDAGGYDHSGERFSLWGFLRVGLDRGGPGEPEKGEDVDLEGFGMQIHPDGPRG